MVVAENVEGLIRGNARGYVNEILKAFRDAGYSMQVFLLDSSVMGVPQKRIRVFFIGHRTELGYKKLKLAFNEAPIPFRSVRTEEGKEITSELIRSLLGKMKKGDRNFSNIAKREFGSESYFSHVIVADNRVAPTVTSGGSFIREFDKKEYAAGDFVRVQSFPEDYNFLGQGAQYVCGMSVPPVMMANIAAEIFGQWLKYDK